MSQSLCCTDFRHLFSSGSSLSKTFYCLHTHLPANPPRKLALIVSLLSFCSGHSWSENEHWDSIYIKQKRQSEPVCLYGLWIPLCRLCVLANYFIQLFSYPSKEMFSSLNVPSMFAVICVLYPFILMITIFESSLTSHTLLLAPFIHAFIIFNTPLPLIWLYRTIHLRTVQSFWNIYANFF